MAGLFLPLGLKYGGDPATTQAGFFFPLFFSVGSVGDAPPDARPYPPPAGGVSKRKRRRYELPNGLHVYATYEQAQAVAAEMLGEERAQREPPRPTRRKVVAGPMREVVLDAPAQPSFIEFSQQAHTAAIAYENLIKQWRSRRRRKIALLLAS